MILLWNSCSINKRLVSSYSSFPNDLFNTLFWSYFILHQLLPCKATHIWPTNHTIFTKQIIYRCYTGCSSLASFLLRRIRFIILLRSQSMQVLFSVSWSERTLSKNSTLRSASLSPWFHQIILFLKLTVISVGILLIFFILARLLAGLDNQCLV